MPSLFKRSNGVYYIVYEENGKRKWKTTGETLKTTAMRFLLDFRRLQKQGKKVSLKDFIDEFLSVSSAYYRPKTLALYSQTLRNLLSFVGNKSLPAITARDIDHLKAVRMKEVSPTKVKIDLVMLKAAFHTAMRWGYVSENPIKKVAMPLLPQTMPVYLGKEEFQRLLSVVKQEWLKDLIIVAACTGLRQGEVLSFEWKDIDFDRRLLTVRNKANFKTKAGKVRSVPLNDVVRLILQRRFQQFAATSSKVFSLGDKPISSSYVSHLFKAYVRKVGLDPKLHFHSLRHTFATWLVQEGVSIYEVQKLLGHSSISVTQIYSHLAASELHGAVNKISIPLN